MALAELLIGLIIALLFILVVVRCVRIVPQARARNVERLGRYRRTLKPGLNFVVPLLDRVKPMIDLREQVVTFRDQPVITKDNTVVYVDTVLFFRVTDPRKADYEIVNYIQAIEQLTAAKLRKAIGSMELKETMTSRDPISVRLRDELDKDSDEWGVQVTRLEIKEINPPQSVIDTMKEDSVSRLTDEQARAIATSGMSQDSSSLRRSLPGDGFITRSDYAAVTKAWHESDEYASSRKQRRYLIITLLGVLVITMCLTFTLMVWKRASWHLWSPVLFTGLAIAICLASFWPIVAKNTRLSFADFRDNYQAGADSKSLADEEQLPDRWLTDPDLQNLIILNRTQIGVYQDIATGDAKRAARNSQIAMSFGFLILVAGAAVTIVTPDSVAKIVVGVLASLGSVLSGYIGRTFLKAQDQAMYQLNYYFRQPLVTSYMLAAERLTLKLSENAQAKQNALKDVIKNLLIAAGRAEQLDSSLSQKSRRGVRRRPIAESSTTNETSLDT